MKTNLIIISGPSGSGEDSIIEGLKEFFSLERVITTTTRQMRQHESEGKPYYFISKEEFADRIDKDDFFEYARHYNNHFYGVTFAEIERVKNSGKIGIWKIDYKGVIKAKELMPEVPAIFINSPLEVLRERIMKRDGVSGKYVDDRMKYTKEWLKHTDIYDYTIDNEQGKLDKSIQEAKRIIESLPA